MKVSFKKSGWTITTDEIVPFGSVSDWRPILAKVRENAPEVISNTDYILYNAIGATLNFDAHPRGKEVSAKYKAEYGVGSGAYGTGLYEMTTIYFDALAKVGDARDHDAIGKAIGQTKRTIVAGNLEFDPKTHVAREGKGFVPVTFFQLQDGKGVMISPAEFKSGDFKTPEWMSK